MDKVQIKAYNKMLEITKKLKNICSIFYISKNTNSIYLKSLVRFTEIFGECLEPDKIEPYRGCLILPNKFTEFDKLMKELKIKKNDVELSYIDTESETVIVLKLPDNNGKLEIPMIYFNHKLTKEIEDEKISSIIIPDIYEKYFAILSHTNYSSLNKGISLSELDIEVLTKPDLLIKDVDGIDLYLAKEIFEDIRKTDSISASLLDTDYNEEKYYFMINHTNDYYTMHIIQGQKK